MYKLPLIAAAVWLAGVTASTAAISISGVTDRMRYSPSVSFTVNGATSAILDGSPVTVGVSNFVSTVQYHELVATDGVTTQTVRFIVRSAERLSTEDGIPPMVPYHFVNDAPSAFAGGVLSVMVPAVYPQNLPVPVVARLTKGASFGALAGDPLFLNGVVTTGNFPTSPAQLRRGWGSNILPAFTAAGTKNFDAGVNGLTAPAPITVEAATSWTNKSGNVAGLDNWGNNARIFLTANLIVAAGGTVSIGPGTIVRCAPGVEIWVRPGGSLQINGTTAAPVVFVPDSTSSLWGGIWLQPQSGASIAHLTATGTIFCCWGANQNWFATAPAGEPAKTFPDHHKNTEPCVAVATGAVCSLTDCALIGPTGLSQTRGAGFATYSGTLLVTRTLVQRCITGGVQENSPALNIQSSAILEMTEVGTDVDSAAFVDADNDGIYLVPYPGHTYNLSKTVIGWTKDDGIDTGGDGAGSTICHDCWFENCVHEAISNSGVDRIPETHDGVHFNCGQGMECGYGGPHSLVDHTAIIGCMVGARYGDNYGNNSGSSGSGTSQYIGDITVQNSFCLYNLFHDTWAIDFSTWNFQNPKLILKGSKVTKAGDLAVQNGAEDTGNSLWNPASDGASLAAFMPVPNSNVGVDLLVTKRQDVILNYAGIYDVRLSTFSAKPVSVGWSVLGKSSPEAATESTILSGTLNFAPGETVKSIMAAFPGPNLYGQLVVSLHEPVNAEVTGAPVYYFSSGAAPADQVLIAKGAAGWDYQALRVEPANDANAKTWKQSGYIEATWQTNKTAPIGFGVIGDPSIAAGQPGSTITLGTTMSTAEQGSSADRTQAVYFRKTFTVANPADVKSLTLDYFRDDAVVFYLNGIEITRENIDSGTTPGGTITYSTLATNNTDLAAEVANHSFVVPAAFLSNLVAGTNLLAVEVHQQSITSSDLALDVKLTASFNPPGGATFGVGSTGGSYFIYWLDDAKVLDVSADLAQWASHPEYKSPFPLVTNQPRMFYRLH